MHISPFNFWPSTLGFSSGKVYKTYWAWKKFHQLKSCLRTISLQSLNPDFPKVMISHTEGILSLSILNYNNCKWSNTSERILDNLFQHIHHLRLTNFTFILSMEISENQISHWLYQSLEYLENIRNIPDIFQIPDNLLILVQARLYHRNDCSDFKFSFKNAVNSAC